MIIGELLMLNMIKRFQAKEWFIITILMLLITDLVILLNLPVLRDIIPFLFFSIIPGFLIVTILRLNKIEFLIKFLLSVGLSISILLALGLFLNILYPDIITAFIINAFVVIIEYFNGYTDSLCLSEK